MELMKKRWHAKRWEEGNHVDLWTLNHILGGGVLASICIYIGWDFWTSLIISFLIMLSWDLFEIARGIKEHTNNKIWDIVTGLSGFFATYYLMTNHTFNNLIFFLVILIPFVILEIWGYLTYMKILK